MTRIRTVRTLAITVTSGLEFDLVEDKCLENGLAQLAYTGLVESGGKKENIKKESSTGC